MSPTPHDSDHPPADTKSIFGWMQELPEECLDTITDLTSIALARLGQLRSSAVNHPEIVSDLENQEKRFRLLMDGDGDLDERLFNAPDVRSSFVTNLKALVRHLYTAIGLCALEQRKTLSKKTDKVVGEASEQPLLPGEQLACGSLETAPEDLKAINVQINDLIANLYGLLLTSRHLCKISDALEAWQNDEVESGKRRLILLDKLKSRARNLYRRVRTSILPTSDSSSAFHSGENSCVPSSMQANLGSSRSNSPSDPSLFSDNGTHGRVRPLTNTSTSTSLSQEALSSSKLTASNSFRESNSRNGRNATLDEAEKTFEPEVSGGQLKLVKRSRMVLIKHQNCERYLQKVMLIDTGADPNLIRRSVADELGLTIIPSNSEHHTGLDGCTFKSHGLVVPEWHFLDKPKPEQKRIRFGVIDKIPNNIDILLGKVSSEAIGIDLYERDLYQRSVCVAHSAPEDTIAQKQRKQQRTRQDHDTTENENMIRQKLEAEHAELIRQRDAAADAPGHTKPGMSTSRSVVFGSGDVRR